jgi:hypothetical protein
VQHLVNQKVYKIPDLTEQETIWHASDTFHVLTYLILVNFALYEVLQICLLLVESFQYNIASLLCFNFTFKYVLQSITFIINNSK